MMPVNRSSGLPVDVKARMPPLFNVRRHKTFIFHVTLTNI